MKFATVPLLVATAVFAAGCASDHDHAHTHEDLVSRTELQRLENEIGKLEFRLFELENQTAPVGSDPAAEPLPPVIDDAGNFDLTPVQ